MEVFFLHTIDGAGESSHVSCMRACDMTNQRDGTKKKTECCLLRYDCAERRDHAALLSVPRGLIGAWSQLRGVSPSTLSRLHSGPVVGVERAGTAFRAQGVTGDRGRLSCVLGISSQHVLHQIDRGHSEHSLRAYGS